MKRFVMVEADIIRTPKKQPDAIIVQRNNDMYRLKHYSILAICALAILFFSIHGFWASEVDWDWLDTIFATFAVLVAITPVVCIHFFLKQLKLSVSRFIFYFCSIIIIFLGCYVYYHVEFADRDDAYRDLFYIFLPPVQIILLGGFFLIFKTIEAINRKIAQKRYSGITVQK